MRGARFVGQGEVGAGEVGAGYLAGTSRYERVRTRHRAGGWAEALPARVVAKWLGYSPLVAAKHFLQTRDAHFEVAIRSGARTEPLR